MTGQPLYRNTIQFNPDTDGAQQVDEPKSEPLSQADYEALANLRYALRQFTVFSSTEAQAAGLPPQQHQALLAIKGHPAGQMTIGVLAERLLIAPQTATELVNRLAEAGLVDRIPHLTDRRRQELFLTAKAEALMQPLSIVHLRRLRQMAPTLIEILQAFGG